MTARKPTRTAARRAATRGERIDFRMNPATKELLVRAASLCGSSLTAFVLESAQERAVEIIEQYERRKLTNRDRFFAALAEPPRPMAALRKLFEKQATSAR